MREAWRFALGTFTALPVRPPQRVDRPVVGLAMLLAPATTGPAALAWVLASAGTGTGLPAAVAAVVALLATALLSRALHLDGLADLADGLTSGHDPGRSLEVMRRGNTGPAGAAALVLVLLLDAACLTTLFGNIQGTALAVVALVASRLACAVCARDGIPPARPEGLGRGVAGTVSRARLASAVTVMGLLAAAAGVGTHAVAAGGATASWLLAAGSAVAVVLAAVVAALATRRHAVRRLGGITGDVVGAAIEVSLAVALVAATVAAPHL